MALGADDSIALAATVINQQESGVEFGVLRYDSSGNLQTGFGTGGEVIDNLGNSALADHVCDVAVAPDGAVVVAGYQDSVSDPLDLVRYLPDGSRDANFGDDGVVTDSSLTPLSGYCLAVQADGKILVGGMGSSNHSFSLARFDLNGSLDTSFAGGVVVQQFSGLQSRINSLAIEPDGRIVAAGVAGPNVGSQSSSNEGMLARYMPGNVGSLSVRVDNTAPDFPLTLSGDATVAAGDTYYLSLGDGSTDFGSGSAIQYVIDWGDEVGPNADTTTFTADQLNALDGQVTHVYTAGMPTPTINVSLVNGGGSPSLVGSMSITVDFSAATVTTLTASCGPTSVLGQQITLWANVTPLDSGYPNGTVDFYDGTTDLGYATVYSDVATFSVSTLAVGDHGITAVYSGDNNFDGSSSSALALSVTPSSSEPVITLSGFPSSSIDEGQSYSLTLSAAAQLPSDPIDAMGDRLGRRRQQHDSCRYRLIRRPRPIPIRHRATTSSSAVATDSLGNQYTAVLDADCGGGLDTSFGGGPVTGDSAALVSVAVQPDGSIVAAGSDGSLVRYDRSGNPDGTSLRFQHRRHRRRCRATAGGQLRHHRGRIGFSAARYNSDGSLDATFGSDGIAISPLPLGEGQGEGGQGAGRTSPCTAGRRDRVGGLDARRRQRRRSDHCPLYSQRHARYQLWSRRRQLCHVRFRYASASFDAALQTGNRVVVAVDCGGGTANSCVSPATACWMTPRRSRHALRNLGHGRSDGGRRNGFSRHRRGAGRFDFPGRRRGNAQLRSLKYLPDGEGLDYSFNSAGVAQGPFSEAAAVAIEPSGRIIVAGVDTPPPTNGRSPVSKRTARPTTNFGTLS